MNILFTTSAAPEKSPFFTSEKRPPLGLGSLISLTKKEGHRVFFIDNYLKPSKFIEKGFLQKNKIDLVGIYANTICYRDTLRMFNGIEKLRKKGLWKGKIAVGGPHTSVAVENIPKFVDYIVQGEGEKAILEIVNKKAKQKIFRKERIKDLDSLPFEPWDIFNKLPYDYSCPWMDSKPVFTMNTSRGCPFNCAFCSVGSIWGREYTFFSAERIIAEIEYLVKNFDAKGIYFREDNFTLNLKRTEEFCKKLIKKNINIDWACETRVDTLTEKLIKLMSKAGCRAFYLGVESGSQKVLDRLNKNINVKQTEKVIKLCKKYNIKAYCSLIVGTPGETFEDYLLTKKLIDKLKPYSHSFNIFVGIPYGPLYKYILEKKLYEYIDEVGLIYLPGYDIKAKFFYGMDSKNLVDYDFKQRTDFDKKLLKELANKNPKVTVLMSVYNGEKYLREAIDSIINQTFKDFEFLIINDGSTDNTAKILKSYKDPRIKIITNKKNIGLTKSLNNGLRIAKGEYIARMDHDDISALTRLTEQTMFLDQHSNIAVLGTNFQIIDSSGKVKTGAVIENHLSSIRIEWELYWNNPIVHSSVMFRTTIVKSYGGYPKEKYCQDYALWLQMFTNIKMAIIKQPLFFLRKHGKNVSTIHLYDHINKTVNIVQPTLTRELGYRPSTRCIHMAKQLPIEGTASSSEFKQTIDLFLNTFYAFNKRHKSEGKYLSEVKIDLAKKLICLIKFHGKQSRIQSLRSFVYASYLSPKTTFSLVEIRALLKILIDV